MSKVAWCNSRSLPEIISRFLRREDGAVVIVYVSLVMVVLTGFVSLAIDLGALHAAKRRQQAATDLAAMAAASDLSRASAAAAANLRANGYEAEDLASLTLGRFEPDPTLPSTSRFDPGTVGEAVHLEVRTAVATLFAGPVTRAFSGGEGINSIPVTTRAVAAADRRAAFAIGSRLVRVNGGVINSVLGALLGTSFSLTAADYEALASTHVDLFTFSEKLASQLNLAAGTYTQVADVDVPLGDALRAVHAAAVEAGAGSRAVAALDTIARGTLTSRRVVDLNQLMAFGYSGSRLLGQPPLSATVSGFDLVTALAQIANRNRQVETAIVATLPGVAAANLKVIVGERPVGSSMVAVGKEGATVHTAQVRLQLDMSLVGSGLATFVQLPLYVDVARASARLSALTCEPWAPTTSQITLMVRPGVVDGRIGTVSSSQFAATASAPTHTPATLVQIPSGASVTGHSRVTWSNTAETAQTFSYADAVARTKKTTSTTTSPSALVTSLVSNLSLGLLGVDLTIPGLLVSTRQIVTNHVPVIDELLLSTLTALGANVGQADTWVSGVRCGTSVLAN